MLASSSQDLVQPPLQSPPALPLRLPGSSDVDPAEDASEIASVVTSRSSADQGSVAGSARSTRRQRKVRQTPKILLHTADGEVTVTGKEANFEQRMEAWMQKVDTRLELMTNLLHAYVDTSRASTSSDPNRLAGGVVNSLAMFRANLIKRGREAVTDPKARAALRDMGPYSREGSAQSLSVLTGTGSVQHATSSEEVSKYDCAVAGHTHVKRRGRKQSVVSSVTASVTATVFGRMRRTSVASEKKATTAEDQDPAESLRLANVVPQGGSPPGGSRQGSPRQGGSPRTAAETGSFGLRARSDTGSEAGGHSSDEAPCRPRTLPCRTSSYDMIDSPKGEASPARSNLVRDPPVEADASATTPPAGAGRSWRLKWQKGNRSTRSLEEKLQSGELQDEAIEQEVPRKRASRSRSMGSRTGATPVPSRSASKDPAGEDRGRPGAPGLTAVGTNNSAPPERSAEGSACEGAAPPGRHSEAGVSSERQERNKHRRRGYYHQFAGGSQGIDTAKVEKVQKMTKAMSRDFDMTESQAVRRMKSSQSDPELEKKLKYRMHSMRSAVAHNTSMLASLIKHHHFDTAITIIVLLNALLIGAHTQLQALHYNNAPSTQVFLVAEHSCTLIFLVELVARIWVHQGKFLSDLHEKYWNAFDASLVFVSLLDLVITMSVADDDSGSVLKVLRVIRVARVMRILRTVRFVSELRVMVQMIISSMLSLSWILVIMVALIYVFSIILTTGATDYLSLHVEKNSDARPSQYDHVHDAFGSLFETMYTLYKAMAGGIDWAEVASLLREAGWVYEAILICYTFFTIFAVINIVTGVFVDGAIEFAKRDRTMQIQKRAREMAYHEGNLLALLQAIDHDGDNLVSAADFKIALQRAEVREFISAMQVEISDAHAFFDLLDADSSGEVDIVEFVTGMQRLRGEAKSVDIHMMVHENRKMLSMVTGLIDILGSTMGGLIAPPPTRLEESTAVQDFGHNSEDEGTLNGQPSPRSELPVRSTSSSSSEDAEEASELHLPRAAFEGPEGSQLGTLHEATASDRKPSSERGRAAPAAPDEVTGSMSPTWAQCWEPARG